MHHQQITVSVMKKVKLDAGVPLSLCSRLDIPLGDRCNVSKSHCDQACLGISNTHLCLRRISLAV